MALTFTVIPKKPQLIVPAKSTPLEIKALSDIDDQYSLRFHFPIIMFYRNTPSVDGVDPADVIREALAKTLVYYYPYAGRLIEGPDHNKLMVDCTAEGVLFLEADAGVSLYELGDTIRPPFQHPQLLLFDVPGFDGILGSPLILVQVTRFKCGGFALALRFNHVMGDGFGSLQFVKAMSEMAKGGSTPSILPVWQRELLTARIPPSVTNEHPEYERDNKTVISSLTNDKDVVKRSFSFGREEIKAIQRNLSPEARSSSDFELITACLWRSRTRALQFDPEEITRIVCPVDVRIKNLLPIPKGYYGNAVIFPARVSKVKTLCGSPLEYAIKLVKQVKDQATEDYARSTIDFNATVGRSLQFRTPRNFVVTDASKIGFEKLDFGWGNAIYGGSMDGGSVENSIYGRYKNRKGEQVVVAPIILPIAAMERFQYELRRLIYAPSKL